MRTEAFFLGQASSGSLKYMSTGETYQPRLSIKTVPTVVQSLSIVEIVLG
jgi:hypothetical protein